MMSIFLLSVRFFSSCIFVVSPLMFICIIVMVFFFFFFFFFFLSSKSVPASTRLEDPSRKGTTRTAKSAPFNPCPSREGPYSTVFSVSRPMDPLMWLAGLLALSGDVEKTFLLSFSNSLTTLKIEWLQTSRSTGVRRHGPLPYSTSVEGQHDMQ